MRKLKDSALALIRNRTEQPLVSVFDTTLVQKLSKIKGREKREIIVSHLKKEKEKEEGDKLKESKKDTVDDSGAHLGEGMIENGKEKVEIVTADGWAILNHFSFTDGHDDTSTLQNDVQSDSESNIKCDPISNVESNCERKGGSNGESKGDGTTIYTDDRNEIKTFTDNIVNEENAKSDECSDEEEDEGDMIEMEDGSINGEEEGGKTRQSMIISHMKK